MTNILVIDDHEVVRAGLKAFLENMILGSVVSVAWNSASALEKMREKEFDLVILDVNIPGTDSAILTSDLLALKPKTRILMFTMNAEEVYAKKYLQLGVKGYVNKSAPLSEVILAIKTVLENKKYMSTSLKEALAEAAIGKNSSNPFNNLSPREFQVFQYLIKGRTSAEIMSVLDLNASTVGTYKARVLKKLKCKNVIELNTLGRLHNISID
jgi:DNA-binding NarL/FixJ family response regulator